MNFLVVEGEGGERGKGERGRGKRNHFIGIHLACINQSLIHVNRVCNSSMNLRVLLCLIDVDLMSEQRVEFGWEGAGGSRAHFGSYREDELRWKTSQTDLAMSHKLVSERFPSTNMSGLSAHGVPVRVPLPRSSHSQRDRGTNIRPDPLRAVTDC